MDPDRLLENVTAHADYHYRALDAVDPATAAGVRQTLRKWISGVLELIELGDDRIAIAELDLWCPVPGCDTTIGSRGGPDRP